MRAHFSDRIAARLALGAVVMTLLVAALGAVALHLLLGLSDAVVARSRTDGISSARWVIAGFVALAGGLSGGLALWIFRAVPRRPRLVAPLVQESQSPLAVPPVFPYVDRRGPNRAENIVRPAFGPLAAPARTGKDEWEAF